MRRKKILMSGVGRTEHDDESGEDIGGRDSAATNHADRVAVLILQQFLGLQTKQIAIGQTVHWSSADQPIPASLQVQPHQLGAAVIAGNVLQLQTEYGRK